MDRYAVVGHPIAHSQSPFIHARFAEQTGESVDYGAMDVPEADFAEAVRAFFAGGGRGLNVTVPHKGRAWQLSERRSEVADEAGAVNTLYIGGDGRLTGENTDGIGMVRDIVVNHGAPLEGSRVLLLGAGGAVRGVMPALLAEVPARVTIANRTVSRARELAELFGDRGSVQATGFEALADEPPFDLVINGTSAGLQAELPPVPGAVVGERTWCYDMIYGAGRTAFQQWALDQGACRALDGCGMLVEQAAESFRIWRGVAPRTAPVITALRERLRQDGGS